MPSVGGRLAVAGAGFSGWAGELTGSYAAQGLGGQFLLGVLRAFELDFREARMSRALYENAPIRIRDDLAGAHGRAWDHISGPGTWWSGAKRVSMAAETRHAVRLPALPRAKGGAVTRGRIGLA